MKSRPSFLFDRWRQLITREHIQLPGRWEGEQLGMANLALLRPFVIFISSRLCSAKENPLCLEAPNCTRS